jgi:hypothetical protein
MVLFAVGWSIHWCTACSPKAIEAEARYGSEQYHECVAPEPILGSRASREERLAAWARVDACRARVRARWGVSEVMTDAGAEQ